MEPVLTLCDRSRKKPDRCRSLGSSWRPRRIWTGREPSAACLVQPWQPSPLPGSPAGCQTLAQPRRTPAGCSLPRPPRWESHSHWGRTKVRGRLFSCVCFVTFFISSVFYQVTHKIAVLAHCNDNSLETWIIDRQCAINRCWSLFAQKWGSLRKKDSFSGDQECLNQSSWQTNSCQDIYSGLKCWTGGLTRDTPLRLKTALFDR